MEQVLDAYARPYDAARPVLCIDEQPVQLVRETRRLLPAAGARPRRTKADWAREVADLLEGR